jgi:hypothetical protein
MGMFLSMTTQIRQEKPPMKLNLGGSFGDKEL